MTEHPKDWQTAPLAREEPSLVRWFPVADVAGMTLGLTEHDDWVQWSPPGKSVLRATPDTMLFFLPLLDVDYGVFRDRIAASTGGESARLLEKARALAEATVLRGLRDEHAWYVGAALGWSQDITPMTEAMGAALYELARSKRGTQEQRHAAMRLYRSRFPRDVLRRRE